MTSKGLGPEQVHTIGVAALDNALSLMADAGVLLFADRPRRAYALGLIAAEEYAKSYACRCLLESWPGKFTVADLQATLRPKGDPHAKRYADALPIWMPWLLGACSKAWVILMQWPSPI